MDLTHVHQWGPARRIDYCHFTLIVRACTLCPATTESEDPREFGNEDYPLNQAFAREDCARCRELLRGREPANWTTGRV